MTRFGIVFMVFTSLLCAAHRKPKKKSHVAPKPSGPVEVIQDVSVIDVITGRAIPHQDIVLSGATIAEVRDAKTRGKETRYAIPGLWDMHVHLWFPHSQMPLYVANGVTGVRDMGTDLKRVRTWQKEIAAGDRIGPRIYACGSPVSTAPSDSDDMPVNVVDTPQQAREIFNRYYDQGVDFIKVLNLSPGAFGALAESSRHQGIPFAGHLPWAVSAFEAAEDRMVSMEHLFGVGVTCSRKENELRARGITARQQRDPAAVEAINEEVVKTYDPVGASVVWDTFRRYNVWQTPTLALWDRMLTPPDDSAEALKYIEASVRRKWKPAKSETSEAQHDFAYRLTGDMAKAGVGILAGTDTGDPFTVPGFELHRELALLVKAGLTPAQALRAATTEPAHLMRRDRDLGQIRSGYAADIVLLRENPLSNIANTRTIDTVVLRGHTYAKPAIAKMLSDVAASAPKS